MHFGLFCVRLTLVRTAGRRRWMCLEVRDFVLLLGSDPELVRSLKLARMLPRERVNHAASVCRHGAPADVRQLPNSERWFAGSAARPYFAGRPLFKICPSLTARSSHGFSCAEGTARARASAAAFIGVVRRFTINGRTEV